MSTQLLPQPARTVAFERDGRVRRLTVLHPAVGARYVRLGAAVSARVEASLGPQVAANRVASACVEPPHLRLRPWRAERRRFRAALAELAGSAGALAFADVRDCYRSIRPSAVATALRSLGCDAAEAEALETFLRRLEPAGVAGLPVGPAPSAMLANAVLATADRALAVAGIRHLRWVDDVVLAARDPADARRGLEVLRAALRPLGLELNERKTRVVVDPASWGWAAPSAAGGPATVG